MTRSTSVKTSSDPYDLLSSDRGQRRLAAGRRLREPDVGDPVALALGLDAGHEPLGALGHVLGRHGLGRLGAHLVGLLHELPGLLLRVRALALAALLVGLALQQVRLPAHRVLVELGPVRVEVEHLGADGFEQAGVVGDHDDAARVVLEVRPQPDHRVGVEVVGGLVEEQRVGAREQDPGELDASPLTARERTDRLGQHTVRQAEVRGDPRSLGLGGVATGGHEVVLRTRVRVHRLLARLVGLRRRHLVGVAVHADQHGVETAGREDPVAGRDAQVAGARVLREVADGAAATHRAGGRKCFAGEDLGERRLAGAVAADEPDRVPGVHRERHGTEQELGPCSYLDVRHCEHKGSFFHVCGNGPDQIPLRRVRDAVACTSVDRQMRRVMARRFRQVDVFTDRLGYGNPLAVVADADGLDDETMARFARWTNLSETTFLLTPTTLQADYRVRIFTPGGELPFAGHPTLGTCHTWLSLGGQPRGDRVVQECAAGLVPLRRDGDALAFAAPPLHRGPVPDDVLEAIVSALGIVRRGRAPQPGAHQRTRLGHPSPRRRRDSAGRRAVARRHPPVQGRPGGRTPRRRRRGRGGARVRIPRRCAGGPGDRQPQRVHRAVARRRRRPAHLVRGLAGNCHGAGRSRAHHGGRRGAPGWAVTSPAASRGR